MKDDIVTKHRDASTLSASDQQLLARAREAITLAYAPYSKFHVGAAVQTADGHIILGANQENASFPLCICGERVALYNAAIHHPGQRIMACAICVSGQKELSEPAPPCGACLQVLHEFEERQDYPIRLLLQADSELVYEIPRVSALMPLSFDRKFL
jgi:cytidine deaminase